MQALEAAEEGPPLEQLSQFVYQAQLARNLTEDLLEFIVDEGTEDDV